MNKAYELVIRAKAAQGIDSDNAFAVKNGFSRAHVNNWKAGLANPSAVNYLKLAKAAGLNIDEALAYLETPEYMNKQAGFANLTLVSGIAGVTFSYMSHMPEIALLAGVAYSGYVYYVK